MTCVVAASLAASARAETDRGRPFERTLLTTMGFSILALALVAAVVALFDLAIYWAHRWSHEVPALWRFHAVHHSTEHLDWISGFRNHPLDGKPRRFQQLAILALRAFLAAVVGH